MLFCGCSETEKCFVEDSHMSSFGFRLLLLINGITPLFARPQADIWNRDQDWKCSQETAALKAT